MDGLIDVAQVVDVVLHAGELFRVGQQALHLGFRAAVAQFQVVQHGVILLCEALIGVLDALHRRAHLGRVVRHVLDRGVRREHSLRGVPAVGGLQRSAEAHRLLRVIVSADAVFGRLHGEQLHGPGRLLIDRVQTAEALLQRSAGVEGVLQGFPDGRPDAQLSQAAQQLLSDGAAGFFRAGGAAVQQRLDFALDPGSLWDDIHICVAKIRHRYLLRSFVDARPQSPPGCQSPRSQCPPRPRSGPAGWTSAGSGC